MTNPLKQTSKHPKETIQQRAKRLGLGDQRVHLLKELEDEFWEMKTIISNDVKDQAFVAFGISICLNLLHRKMQRIKDENVLKGIFGMQKKSRKKGLEHEQP